MYCVRLAWRDFVIDVVGKYLLLLKINDGQEPIVYLAHIRHDDL